MRQSVRIIGGRYRGKKLGFPDVEHLRPTPDRVRETLFNWLMHKIRGARCLDAFAGSGSLGFEAFSRGARQVVMVESSALAYSSLCQTAASFNAPELQIVHADIMNYLQKEQEAYDIIFLDPPFSSDCLQACINLLLSRNCLAPDALLYIESAAPSSPDPDFFQELKLKKAGQVFYGLYSFSA